MDQILGMDLNEADNFRGAPERNVSGRTGGVQGEMGTAAEFVQKPTARNF